MYSHLLHFYSCRRLFAILYTNLLLVIFEFAVDVGNIIQKQSPVCEVDQSYTSGCSPYSQSWDPV